MTERNLRAEHPREGSEVFGPTAHSPLATAALRNEAVVALMLHALAAQDLVSYLKDTLKRIADILEVECCAVHVAHNADELTLLIRSDTDHADDGSPAPKQPRRTISQHALGEAGPIVAQNYVTEDRFECDHPVAGRAAMSAMSAAIHHRDGLYGTITVYSGSLRAFDASDTGLLQDIANTLGHVIDRDDDRQRWVAAQEVEARRAGLSRERYHWLSDAASILACSQTKTEALNAAATLAVGALADYCAVDIVHPDDEHGSIQRVAVAMRADDRPKAQGLLEYYPNDPLAPHGTPRALRTGRPEIIERVDESVLRATARDDEHLRAIREANVCTYMCIPLQVGPRVVGALCLSRTPSDQACDPYNSEDLALAEGLARCVALMIGHGLHDAATQSVQQTNASLANLAEDSPRLVTTPAQTPKLNKRQTELLALLAQGWSNGRISDETHISYATVAKHVSIILRALEAPNRFEAVVKARALGLLDNS